MKILFIEWPKGAAIKRDVKRAFIAEGHSLISCDIKINAECEKILSEILKKEFPEIVFSLNYFPDISNICNKKHIPYISWVFDNPHLPLFSTTVVNPCNIIYVFDKTMYMQFHNAGISTIRYLPLAVNIERLDHMSQGRTLPFLYDISFVGSLYVEKGNFYDQMVDKLPDYARGYLDALVAAQLKIQGYNFIEEVLEPVIDDLYKAFPIAIRPGETETREYLYAQGIINRRITAIERIDLLDAAGKNYTVDLFTYYKGFKWPNLRNHGRVDYEGEMPLVFKQSKINLNITLRSIHSGIPLRAFDIMGAGGFLLSNYQADFEGLFVPEDDYVYYDSKDDFVKKIDYYLKHEDERVEIAKNGHEKVAARHTYTHRVREMLDCVILG